MGTVPGSPAPVWNWEPASWKYPGMPERFPPAAYEHLPSIHTGRLQTAAPEEMHRQYDWCFRRTERMLLPPQMPL